MKVNRILVHNLMALLFFDLFHFSKGKQTKRKPVSNELMKKRTKKNPPLKIQFKYASCVRRLNEKDRGSVTKSFDR